MHGLTGCSKWYNLVAGWDLLRLRCGLAPGLGIVKWVRWSMSSSHRQIPRRGLWIKFQHTKQNASNNSCLVDSDPDDLTAQAMPLVQQKQLQPTRVVRQNLPRWLRGVLSFLA